MQYVYNLSPVFTSDAECHSFHQELALNVQAPFPVDIAKFDVDQNKMVIVQDDYLSDVNSLDVDPAALSQLKEVL